MTSAVPQDPLARIIPIVPEKLDFDPDEVARRFGEAHLIPPTVRRLSKAEIREMYPAKAGPPQAIEHERRGRGLGGIEL